MELKVIIRKKVIEVDALVESESIEGAFYLVKNNGIDLDDGYWSCTCPDHQKRKNSCKHIQAVRNEI